jgi:quercetin dioxygenase-like cupin family protein
MDRIPRPDGFPVLRRSRAVHDTTVKKVQSANSPRGEKGEIHLAMGKHMGMRLWKDEAPTDDKPPHSHDYEVVGYVISGRAELEIEGQTITLEPGDSWLVPPNSEHRYRIIEPFTAVEATSPPSAVHGR